MLDVCLLGTGGMMPLPERHLSSALVRCNGRLVLLSGESGMGKTVLLEAFQQRMPGARWLWGGCERLMTPRPSYSASIQ